jgi:pimeloyl-ACP methyl ester carboxylesterase
MGSARWIALGAVMVLAAVAVGAAAGGQGSARGSAAGVVGTSFPTGFPTIVDASLGRPVIGFGGAGRATRTPVIFLHGNNDTPFPTACNVLGDIHHAAQFFLDRGYAPSEVWGLGYQGDQCDLVASPTNRSAFAHSTEANVDDLARFVRAVLRFTGAKRVDIVGHSLGGTLAREWMRRDKGHRLVRHLVTIASPNHGIVSCSPNPANSYALPVNGGFTPDSAICREYGSDRTPFLQRLNRKETPGPTRYLSIYNADTDFVYISAQDGIFAAAPAEDRDGRPHDFSSSPMFSSRSVLEGKRATNVPLTGQGAYSLFGILGGHLGIVNSPVAWQLAYDFVAGGGDDAEDGEDGED